MNTADYEAPILTELGDITEITHGQNGRVHSDDSDGSGYWN